MDQSEAVRPDFICVGAQKCGTTSLAKYLGSHPGIYMAPEKELNYWSDADAAANGVQWYLKEYFSSAEPQQVWGEATVRYLHTEGTAARIKDNIGYAKIIAILRDPIARALSHYRMSYRRGYVQETFEDIMTRQLRDSARANEPLNENDDFLRMGEYSQQLREYFEQFPHDDIQIIFLENLSRDPAAVLATVFRWLGVTESHVVPSLGKRYNVGGDARVEGMHDKVWYRTSRRLARAFLPAQLRRTVGFWLETEWNVQPDEAPPIPDQIIEQLVQYYATEIVALEALIGQKVPWPRWPIASPSNSKS